MSHRPWKLIAACVLGWLGAAAFAQDLPLPTNGAPSPQAVPEPAPVVVVDDRFVSPRDTFATFLEAMRNAENSRLADREAALRQAARCINLPRLTGTMGPNRAVMLKFVIERIGVYPGLPWKGDPSLEERDFVTFYPQAGVLRHEQVSSLVGEDFAITLRRQPNGEWKFSRQTADDITALYVRTGGLTGGRTPPMSLQTLEMQIRQRIPAELQIGRIASVEYWQVLGLVVLVFTGLLLDYLSRFVLALLWRRFTDKDESDKENLKRTVRPFGLLVAAVFWYVALPTLFLPPTALLVLLIAVRVFASLAGVLTAYRLVDLLSGYFMRRAVRTKTHLDDLLIPLARRTLKIVVTIMAVIYVADSFDVEIVPLLTGLGIGGLAFAFAAKDTIENFFGSIAVIADRPFVVGDWVKIDDVEGTVEQLGMRSTRIRTFYNSVVTVPNATLVRATVDNYGRRRFRRFKT
ncbi:MAG: mechanosensitive ion channel domain-containing protein, partial [Planctomycetota bacterium]